MVEKQAFEDSWARLAAMPLETPEERRAALDELNTCGHAFAAYERAQIRRGIPASSLQARCDAFWRWAFAAIGAIREGVNPAR